MEAKVPRRDTPLYRYRFGAVEFDEARQTLSVDGELVELEQRPLQLLAELLRHPDEVVTREELLDSVWAGRPTVDNVLANAVTKLRKALGEVEGARIITLPRIGYRLIGPVERSTVGRQLKTQLALAPGAPVPGRDGFRLEALLGSSSGAEVWRAHHPKSGESRIYKFSRDGERLAALKREATLARLLREALGARDDLIRLLDWNFESPPFFLECEDGGSDLAAWAAQGHLAALDVEARIALFLAIAEAVAAAHSVGVLHKDLKPANVLIARHPSATGEPGWQPKLGDFGSGRLLEPERLEALGITRLGFTVADAATDASGTPLYLAPELIAGRSPTVQSDVYALGLILYQLLVGDLKRPMATGWEQDIADPLARTDIAAATAGQPQQRLETVAALIQRLRDRDRRRETADRLHDAETRAALAERRLERSHGRRPWMLAAAAVLVLGLAVSLWQARRASLARDEAHRQAALAEASNRFLTDDLLGAAGAGGATTAWYQRNPPLREVIDRAAERLGSRFEGAPLVEAGLRRTLGRAYRALGNYDLAEPQLARALTLFDAALGPLSDEAVLTGYERALSLSFLSRFDEARDQLARSDAAAGARLLAVGDVALRAQLAHGTWHYQKIEPEAALARYRNAQRLNQLLYPDDAATAAHIDGSIAGCLLRLQRPREAELIAREMLSGERYSEANVGGAVLASARLNLANALRAQNRVGEAIPYAQAAVGSFEQLEGPDAQRTINALSSLGRLQSMAGDSSAALTVQREVLARSLRRWGAKNQYTLVERMNLGFLEAEQGQRDAALIDLRAAEAGLVETSGAQSALVQAARFGLADLAGDLGRYSEALQALAGIDAKALQATTSDPGRAELLTALKARIVHQRDHSPASRQALDQAITAMNKAGVAASDIEPFQAVLVGQ
ncbi:protein kinase domain-containing protein [Nevskia ramosa]|uniref:protein kinase domain-containing protein n=1 Tax=Nevskia ramosa TaxID=64002 RepID=UPI0003B321CC|nr:tetratricopeptide repeat protein [Nevskia ramosa]